MRQVRLLCNAKIIPNFLNLGFGVFGTIVQRVIRASLRQNRFISIQKSRCQIRYGRRQRIIIKELNLSRRSAGLADATKCAGQCMRDRFSLCGHLCGSQIGHDVVPVAGDNWSIRFLRALILSASLKELLKISRR